MALRAKIIALKALEGILAPVIPIPRLVSGSKRQNDSGDYGLATKMAPEIQTLCSPDSDPNTACLTFPSSSTL